MFADIESVNQQWIAHRESLLRDTVVLVSGLDRKCAEILDSLVRRLEALDAREKARLIKNPTFQRYIRTVNDLVLAAYDCSTASEPLDKSTAELRSTLPALLDVFAAESALSILPTAGCIRIVTGASIGHFKVGGQYGIKLDLEVDPSIWQSLTSSALELIRLGTVNYQLVLEFVSYLVPLKHREVVQNLSFSSRELPNVVFKNNEGSALLFGETLVHEADHQFFYALEECHSFWVIEPRHQSATHHSPWRDDPRPLEGILRGLSAFTRVVDYYSHVLAASDSPRAEQAAAMLVQRVAECDAATTTLLNSNQLTPAGTDYVLELSRILRQADQIVALRERYPKWKADAVAAVEAHQEKWLQSHIAGNKMNAS